MKVLGSGVSRVSGVSSIINQEEAKATSGIKKLKEELTPQEEEVVNRPVTILNHPAF